MTKNKESFTDMLKNAPDLSIGDLVEDDTRTRGVVQNIESYAVAHVLTQPGGAVLLRNPQQLKLIQRAPTPNTPEGLVVGAKVTSDGGTYTGRIEEIEQVRRVTQQGTEETTLYTIRLRNHTTIVRTASYLMPLHERSEGEAWSDVVLLLFRLIAIEGVTDDDTLRHRAYQQLGRFNGRDHEQTKRRVMQIITGLRQGLHQSGFAPSSNGVVENWQPQYSHSTH